MGLLEPLVWNERTGNLVGGHQRLACLDALADSPGYELDVSVVSLTDKQEREQNIALNNPGMQGSWDVPLLTEMLDGIDVELTGFDQTELEVLMGDTMDVAAMFQPKDTDPELPEMAKKKKSKPGLTERRKEMLAAAIVRDDTEFYAVAVFRNREQTVHVGNRPGVR